MENMQRALIMAGSVFMFIIAVSVAIFSYDTVMDVAKSILTSSEQYSRQSEYFVENTEDVERYVTKAEIIMAIYSMEDIDHVADTIKIDGLNYIFKKSDFSSIKGRNNIENNIKHIKEGLYSVSYNFSGVIDDISISQKTVIYKLEPGI